MKARPLFISPLIILFIACASPATPTPVPTEPPQEGKPFIFGDISDDPAEVIEGAQPIASYLASKLSKYGISEGTVRVVTSTEEMIQLLKDGEVDIYFDSTYPATLISDASGAQIILRRWRFGVEAYHSVIYASRDSGITSVDQLNGNMVGMDAPYSTSGFMLPAVYLTEHGLTLAGKRGNNDPVSPEEVGFAFAYDDENVLQWVLSGLVPAGVTDDYNFDTAFPPEAREQLVELARTESTPRQVVLVRPEMDPAMLEEIVQVLTTMDENEEGQAALDTFQTSQFDEFPDGIDTAISRMREMMEIVKNIPLP
jgi:phosphonate transport system substrate-binding protein